jgi:hypothetical protein
LMMLPKIALAEKRTVQKNFLYFLCHFMPLHCTNKRQLIVK